MGVKALYYYLGRDVKHGYPATNMKNILFCYGNHPNDAVAFVNNLVIRTIQEYNPRDLRISLIHNSLSSRLNFNVWNKAFEGTRVIPQLEGITDTQYTVQDCERVVDEIFNLIHYRESTSSDSWIPTLYIISEFDTLYKTITPAYREKLMGVLFNCDRYLVHIVGLTERATTVEPVVNDFEIRCCLKTTKDEFKVLFNETKFMMSTFYKREFYVDDLYEFKKLYIPFYPDTWIEKFCRYYGVRREDVRDEG